MVTYISMKIYKPMKRIKPIIIDYDYINMLSEEDQKIFIKMISKKEVNKMKCKYCGRETNPKRYNSNQKMYAIAPKYCSISCQIKYENLMLNKQKTLTQKRGK